MSYTRFSDFGCNASQKITDPWGYCSTNGIEMGSNHGVDDRYGPHSKKCQLYMSQRCARNWDEKCDAYYAVHKEPIYPNRVTYGSFHSTNHRELSPADILLKNTSEVKYCEFKGHDYTPYPFDENNANSPHVYEITERHDQPTSVVCKVNAHSVDDDPVMKKCLVNPNNACKDTLINICENSKRSGQDLSGTKLGKVCDLYHKSC